MGPGVVKRCLITGSGLYYFENLLTWLFLIFELKYSPIRFNYVDFRSSKAIEIYTWTWTNFWIIIFLISGSFRPRCLCNFIIHMIWVIGSHIIVGWTHLLPIVSSWTWQLHIYYLFTFLRWLLLWSYSLDFKVILNASISFFG